MTLPPSKDLESLLQDAAKPSQYSRSASEQRTGKQITRGVRLPPFPWSHTFNGHCKTSSDSAKLLSNRTTCHGRWVRIGNVASSLGAPIDCFTDLESLTYDQNLVPPRGSKLGTFGTTVLQSISGSFSCCDLGSSSVATTIDASRISLCKFLSFDMLQDTRHRYSFPNFLIKWNHHLFFSFLPFFDGVQTHKQN